jgi:protein-S-isoprenylcysteine O-methyltransferase Ste14
MAASTENDPKSDKPPSRLRIALAFFGYLAAFGALLFVAAGRTDWLAGWLFLAIITINAVVNFAYLRSRNPELIAYRARFGEGTKTWDKIWMGVFASVLVSVFVVAGLDAGRFGFSAMPLALWPVGLALFLPGTMLITWSMGVNPFFEKTVRIQTERGHRVIDTGPYRFVRHPGYAGFLGWMLSTPFFLGSWWAFLPAILATALVVARTALEDRTLGEELPGYLEYAGRVRFRLIPHVW